MLALLSHTLFRPHPGLSQPEFDDLFFSTKDRGYRYAADTKYTFLKQGGWEKKMAFKNNKPLTWLFEELRKLVSGLYPEDLEWRRIKPTTSQENECVANKAIDACNAALAMKGWPHGDAHHDAWTVGIDSSAEPYVDASLGDVSWLTEMKDDRYVYFEVAPDPEGIPPAASESRQRKRRREIDQRPQRVTRSMDRAKSRGLKPEKPTRIQPSRKAKKRVQVADTSDGRRTKRARR